AEFSAPAVSGAGFGTEGVDCAELESAPAVLLVGFEPEEESPIVFLRLRKAFRKRGLKVTSIAPFATRGLEKMGGTLVATAPGGEAAALDALGELPSGTVILVGERLATSPGAYSAALRHAERTGARLGWVPRRAGDRGALEAGAAPNLLPGGRPVADPAARKEVAAGWHVDDLPDAPGRGTAQSPAAPPRGAPGA